jgi:hypothetical protein
MCCFNRWGSRCRPRVESWAGMGVVLEILYLPVLVHALTDAGVSTNFFVCLNCSWRCRSVSKVGIDLSQTQKRWFGFTWGRDFSNSFDILLWPKDRDEVNKQGVFECDGWVCDRDTIGVPSIFIVIRSVAALGRMLTTLPLTCVENVERQKWKSPLVEYGRWTPEVA